MGSRMEPDLALTTAKAPEILRSRADSSPRASSKGEDCPRKAAVLDSATRALWLALMTFFSLALGAVAGLLDWAGGSNPFTATLTGGGAFAATLLLLLAVVHFASSGSRTKR
jgi:hypothetical protein